MASLQQIREKANENIDAVFDYLEISVPTTGCGVDEIRCKCPVHGGDNPTSFCYNLKIMRWGCFSRHCHDHNSDIIGLTKLLLEKKKNLPISYGEAASHLCKFLGLSDGPIKFDDEYYLSKLIRKKYYADEKPQSKDYFTPIPVKHIKNRIASSKYFLDKGFDKDILEKYMVGYCNNKLKPMYLRSYAPILNDDGTMIVGVTGRTIYEKCDHCPFFHPQGRGCPTDDPGIPKYPKWKHYGFNKSSVIYNLNNVDKNENHVIMVEGPKDVWWLDQHGIKKNIVSPLGIDVSKEQCLKLLRTSITKIILILDNDAGGLSGEKKIIESLSKYFTIYTVKGILQDGEDVADLSPERMKNELIPSINKICQKS